MSSTQPVGSYKYQETNKPASYTDGEGNDQVRVVFRVPNSNNFFVVQERIQGNFVVTQANNWFNKALSQELDKGVESI